MRRALVLLLSIALFTAVPAPLLAAPAQPPAIDAGGFIVDGPFLTFVLAHGGLAAFGPPLTDAISDPESGLTVQYFDYARLELHGQQVLLSRLGSLRIAGREDEPPFRWLAPDAPIPAGSAYVAESGHSLGGAFAWYHALNGGVAVLGLPISEEFVERQPDGADLLVQYFERTRLSYHPEAGEVRRAPLGRWLAEAAVPAQQRTPGRPLVALARASLRYNPASGDGANIELAAARLHGAIIEPGAEISFLGAIGEVSAETGYVPGSGIVDGQVTDDLIGGGICTVSTLLFRAAWAAGLPIVERRGHRYLLRAYADVPGLDAAVYTPGQDFRARNDTGARLYVTAEAAGGRATVTLWGRGDGRVVELAPPERRGEGGREVANRRVVRVGGAPRHERLITRYEAPPASPEPPAEPRGPARNRPS